MAKPHLIERIEHKPQQLAKVQTSNRAAAAHRIKDLMVPSNIVTASRARSWWIDQAVKIMEEEGL